MVKISKTERKENKPSSAKIIILNTNKDFLEKYEIQSTYNH